MRQTILVAAAICCSFTLSKSAAASDAFVRVSQVGYESGHAPYRAYLMSTEPETGASFRVLNAKGVAVYSAAIGTQSGTWGHTAKVTYHVYLLDFKVPAATSTPSRCPAP